MTNRMTQQMAEAVQTALGFEDCSLPLITNRPVITLSHTERLEFLIGRFLASIFSSALDC